MRWFGRPDRDYREELETHFEIEVQENVARGMAPDAARQAALRTFGNALSVRDQLGEARPLYFWQTLYRDIRYAARLLKTSELFRQGGFTRKFLESRHRFPPHTSGRAQSSE